MNKTVVECVSCKMCYTTEQVVSKLNKESVNFEVKCSNCNVVWPRFVYNKVFTKRQMNNLKICIFQNLTIFDKNLILYQAKNKRCQDSLKTNSENLKDLVFKIECSKVLFYKNKLDEFKTQKLKVEDEYKILKQQQQELMTRRYLINQTIHNLVGSFSVKSLEIDGFFYFSFLQKQNNSTTDNKINFIQRDMISKYLENLKKYIQFEISNCDNSDLFTQAKSNKNVYNKIIQRELTLQCKKETLRMWYAFFTIGNSITNLNKFTELVTITNEFLVEINNSYSKKTKVVQINTTTFTLSKIAI